MGISVKYSDGVRMTYSRTSKLELQQSCANPPLDISSDFEVLTDMSNTSEFVYWFELL